MSGLRAAISILTGVVLASADQAILSIKSRAWRHVLCMFLLFWLPRFACSRDILTKTAEPRDRSLVDLSALTKAEVKFSTCQPHKPASQGEVLPNHNNIHSPQSLLLFLFSSSYSIFLLTFLAGSRSLILCSLLRYAPMVFAPLMFRIHIVSRSTQLRSRVASVRLLHASPALFSARSALSLPGGNESLKLPGSEELGDDISPPQPASKVRKDEEQPAKPVTSRRTRTRTRSAAALSNAVAEDSLLPVSSKDENVPLSAYDVSKAAPKRRVRQKLHEIPEETVEKPARLAKKRVSNSKTTDALSETKIKAQSTLVDGTAPKKGAKNVISGELAEILGPDYPTRRIGADMSASGVVPKKRKRRKRETPSSQNIGDNENPGVTAGTEVSSIGESNVPLTPNEIKQLEMFGELFALRPPNSRKSGTIFGETRINRADHLKEKVPARDRSSKIKRPDDPRSDIGGYLRWARESRLPVNKLLGDPKRMNIISEKACGNSSHAKCSRW